MNRFGRAGRLGYDAALALWYVIDLSEKQNIPLPHDDIHGRTIRRWRTQQRVAPAALDSLLKTCYASSVSKFLAWCEEAGIDPIRR